MHIENTPHMNNINQNATKLKYLLSALRLGLHLRLLRQQRVVGRLGVDEWLVALPLLREVVVHVPHFDLVIPYKIRGHKNPITNIRVAR